MPDQFDDLDLDPSRQSDLSLRPTRQEPSIGTDPPDAGEGRRPSVWVAIAILIALVAGIAYFIYGRRPLPPEQAEAPPVTRSEAPPAAPAEPLPNLDASDAFIRQLVQQLSSNPQLAAWLATENLVRTFVTIVDKIAVGAAPARSAPFARPAQPFKAQQSGQTWRIDPASFQRYDTLAGVIESVNADGAAKAYARIKPLCEQAYRDLGYPDGDFEKKLSLALARLIDTPVPDEPVELRATSVFYQFADEELESLSPPQKQLLRMGPRNQRVVQAKLREFVKAAGL